jgi:hypothetical protein
MVLSSDSQFWIATAGSVGLSPLLAQQLLHDIAMSERFVHTWPS